MQWKSNAWLKVGKQSPAAQARGRSEGRPGPQALERCLPQRPVTFVPKMGLFQRFYYNFNLKNLGDVAPGSCTEIRLLLVERTGVSTDQELVKVGVAVASNCALPAKRVQERSMLVPALAMFSRSCVVRSSVIWVDHWSRLEGYI